MARPRFHRLPAAQQEAILDAALAEFAAHGFAAASLNRVIAAAGLSKGAMYYYFDGKEDLYADVIRRQLEGLISAGGAMPVPEDAADAAAFWGAVEEYYLRMMRLLAQTPATEALLRDWLTGTSSPSLAAAQHDAEQQLMPWLMRLVAVGQRAGAVRTDLPAEFLIAVAMGMGQAMDTWMIASPPDESSLTDAVHTLVDMMARALGP
ncbi:TetR/AcrR family transcriptional regulator [Microbacterium luticocti]|uniref:TetR/AcrR family transcriptional regulator n=1 Tax=Microbacterium luticocti TaxID=451764 RepID=UPI00041B7BB5|nr:TetR/AcrR family transcriptional regulator [Microbacterium luticocti]